MERLRGGVVGVDPITPHVDEPLEDRWGPPAVISAGGGAGYPRGRRDARERTADPVPSIGPSRTAGAPGSERLRRCGPAREDPLDETPDTSPVARTILERRAPREGDSHTVDSQLLSGYAFRNALIFS